MRTLANGLTVSSLFDPHTANVSVQVWYKVGSKDDPAGRSGFAHLFEHLMFKATRNLPPETFDRLSEDVGGSNNAFTAQDMTAYYEIVPANHLERVLFAEAERMGSLVVDQAAFESEREVVKEELRQRVMNPPYGRLFSLYLPRETYLEHPYRRPGIGSIEELDLATIDEVMAFHTTFYRPDNAHLIVVGQFDEAQLNGWVDRYFGTIPRPARPLPRHAVLEPQRTAARDVTYYAPNVPLPAIVINWQVPPYAHADRAALTVLDAILSYGRSCRLYHSLVYEKQCANEVDTRLAMAQQAGTYSLYAVMAAGHDLAEGETALLAEVARLRDTLATDAELAEAKHEITAGHLRKRESVLGRGDDIGRSLIMTGTADAADRLLAGVQQITAEDVQRVARQYLVDDQRVTLRYLSEDGKPAGVPSEPRTAARAAPIELTSLAPAGPLVELAPEAIRLQLPAAGPERPVPAPHVH
ncbi:MAG: pitrilysin family protein, partial [Polyangiales bacterium]